MKKIIIITIFIFLLFGIWQSCQAVDLLLKYPTIKRTTPTSEGLPGLIKYIYLFALGAAGFVALLSILIGAIMYVFSAGNPSKAADAKNRILSALLGILILLASVLILRTINPDLIEFGGPDLSITPVPNGNGEDEKNGEEKTGYACYCCCSLSCNPKNGNVLFCKNDLKGYQAAEACEVICKKSCSFPIIGAPAYVSQAVPANCP